MKTSRTVTGGWLRSASAAMAVGLATAVLAGWLTRVVLAGWRRLDGSVPAAPDEVLTLTAALLALLIALWLAAATLVEVLSYLPGPLGRAARRIRRELTPLAARRAAAFLVGVSLSSALAPGTALASTRGATGPGAPGFTVSAPQQLPSRAAPGGTPTSAAPGFVLSTPGSASAEPSAPPAPAPGWTPGRPRVRAQPSTDLLTRAPQAERERVVVVRRGDSLWGIAEHHLGTGATDVEIAAEWPRWYHANRDVIGDDPDLIRPGQRLHVPAGVVNR